MPRAGRPSTARVRRLPRPTGCPVGAFGWRCSGRSRGGAAADPGPGHQRAVLGLLAMYPDAAVHRETIIDAVWGHRPPASAVPMVQTYASRLRRLLGDDVLVSDGTSYRLAVTVGQLDALEFAMLADRAGQATASGNPATACRWYERALGLWRGEPLDDVSVM